jgi:hypothetical protein
VGTRHPEYPRAGGDFYTEPSWVVSALFHHISLRLGLHDPCCGAGTIIDTALKVGLQASGADIADRAAGRFEVRDFLADEMTYPNIVTNPPYKHASRIITHALAHVESGGQVAALVPIGFLSSQRRYPLYCRAEFELVLVLSRRPSLPPGELLQKHGESIRHSGSTDFVWTVWRRDRTGGEPRIHWIRP